jgi:pyrroloquinoline quinone (PQQ) biosynthesis protein C
MNLNPAQTAVHSSFAPSSDRSREAVFDAFREIGSESSERQWNALFSNAEAVCKAAFPSSGIGDAVAEEDIHRTLYSLYCGRFSVPWDASWNNIGDYRFDRLRQMMESAWAAAEQPRFAPLLEKLPSVADFPAWAQAHCQADRSNVSHPLFDFLCKEATHEQLREFIFQETPFDIHFGDILATMLPGVYGGAKAELSKNFWDEMGHGVPAMMHRELRLQMTRELGIDDGLYRDAERFCLEELRLANMYFQTVFNRALLPQAIGMLLATELMVPGRLEQQIMGWRRVGWPDSSMRYLLEHVVVDVEHAHGWMEFVVVPLLSKRPKIMSSFVLGIARRLDYAGAVCDRMMTLLPALAPVAA